MSHGTVPADADVSSAPVVEYAVSDADADPFGDTMKLASVTPVIAESESDAVPAVEPTASRTGVGAHAIWVSITALCLCAGGLALLVTRLKASETRALALERSLGEQHATLGRLAQAQRDVPALRDSLAQDLDRGLAATREQSAGMRKELEVEKQALQAEITELKSALEASRRVAQESRLADRRELTDMSARLARSEDGLQRMQARISDLDVRLDRGAQMQGEEELAPNGSPDSEALRAHVKDLANANAGIRWQAVDALGQARDPLAAVHVIPMLQDPDVFVRMAAARVLGELRATNAIKPLIDSLEDAEAAVREAAHFALCAITGRDQKFDAHSSEPERAKRVKGWRDWWKKMEDERGESSG